MAAEWLASSRVDYDGVGLPADVTSLNPWRLFHEWLAAAADAGVPEPGAMALATVGVDGTPQVRMVLLKGADEEGLVFFTNHGSAKGLALEANPVASVLFPWAGPMRQIRATGTVARLDDAQSREYFRSRPRSSQVASWVSQQSRPLASREDLVDAVAAATRRFAGDDVPMPDWGGYVIDVAEFEFWQGMPSRLHDRARFSRTPGGWRATRLHP